MEKIIIVFVAAVLAAVFATTGLAGNMPDYKCGERVSECERGCDEQAENSKNARSYQDCLDRCREMGQKCEERQRVTTGCAEGYMDCLKNAGSDENAVEGCREGYRQCKDN